MNALVLRTDDDEAFRPGEMIATEGRTVLAAVLVYEWALRAGRTEEEVNAARRYLLRGPRHTVHRALTPSLSHPMGEGARRAGEGDPVIYPGVSSVCQWPIGPQIE